MLHIPENTGTTACNIGLDPGSDTLGMACITFSLETGEMLGAWARTLHGAKLARNKVWLTGLFGERVARIEALGENLRALFQHEQPFDIASESPFLGKFAAAYGALVEVICMIRREVMIYDQWKTLSLIDPPSVKKAVGAPIKGGKEGKLLVAKAIKDLVDSGKLKYTGDIPLEDLDEHSNDALAVAYARWLTFRSRFP